MIVKGPVNFRLMKKKDGTLVLQGLMVSINYDWRQWEDIPTEIEDERGTANDENIQQ